MACFCSCSLWGMKQWIRMRASVRNPQSGRQAARGTAPLIAVITASERLSDLPHHVVLPEAMCTCLLRSSPHGSDTGLMDEVQHHSPAHPWCCRCEGYGRSEGVTLYFHQPLQVDNPLRTISTGYSAMPEFSLLRTTPDKKLFRKIVCYSHFVLWVVRAELWHTCKSGSMYYPLRVLQRYTSNVILSLQREKQMADTVCFCLRWVNKLVTGLGDKFCSPATTSQSSWRALCTLIRSARQQVGWSEPAMRATWIQKEKLLNPVQCKPGAGQKQFL